MFDLGTQELIVIFIVAFLVFGPKKLPELGRTLGKGIRELKAAMRNVKDSLDEAVPDVTEEIKGVKWVASKFDIAEKVAELLDIKIPSIFLSSWKKSEEIKKILCIKPRGIGDIILSTIVIENLKSAFPDTEIHYLTEEFAKGAVETNPFIIIIF